MILFQLVVRSDSNLKAGLLGAQLMTGDWGVPKSHTQLI
jgi:hypothetical protein